MNFRPELAAAVLAGEKTVTRRLVSTNPRSPWWVEKCAFRVGQDFAVCPGRSKPQIGRAVVTSVERQVLGRLDDDEARCEGFADWPAFLAGFEAINKRYDPQAVVWRIGFAAV